MRSRISPIRGYAEKRLPRIGGDAYFSHGEKPYRAHIGESGNAPGPSAAVRLPYRSLRMDARFEAGPDARARQGFPKNRQFLAEAANRRFTFASTAASFRLQ